MHDILKSDTRQDSRSGGCGYGYAFDTAAARRVRQRCGSYNVRPAVFMDIYDKRCFTVPSPGAAGRSDGHVRHRASDAMDFIRAKRGNAACASSTFVLIRTSSHGGREGRHPWQLAFPLTRARGRGVELDLDDANQSLALVADEGHYVVGRSRARGVRVYRTLPARRMWDVIMSSTYDFAEPGFVLIDRVNEMNNNWWFEDSRAEPPGRAAASAYGACLLGSINLTKFVVARSATTPTSTGRVREFGQSFTRPARQRRRVNGLPLAAGSATRSYEKRRHGMAFGNRLGDHAARYALRFNGVDSKFTEDGVARARDRGLADGARACAGKAPRRPAPRNSRSRKPCCAKRPRDGRGRLEGRSEDSGQILHSRYSRTCSACASGARAVDQLEQRTGARFTHHSSIAPKGTISLSWPTMRATASIRRSPSLFQQT